jgi:hypothetical protein
MFSKVITSILESKAWRWVVKDVLSNWTFRVFGWTTFKGSNYWKVKHAIEKSLAKHKGGGIFVFCSVDRKLVSYNLNHLITNCKYSHSGIVFIDPDHMEAGELSVKHITTHGFIYEPLQDMLGRIDNLYVGRLPLSDLAEGQRRLAFIEQLVAKESCNFDYDYSLRLEQELIDIVTNTDPLTPTIHPKMLESVRIYCSELIYLIGIGLVEDEDFKARWLAGRYIFEPDDVYRGTEALFEV